MNTENKIYFLKSISLGNRTFLRKLTIVYRKNEWWDKVKSFGVWYRIFTGVGIIGKKDKQFKYFMIGLYLYNTNFWIEFTYLGNKTKKNGTFNSK